MAERLLKSEGFGVNDHCSALETAFGQVENA